MDAFLKQGYSFLKEGKLFESECVFSEIIKKCQRQDPRDYLGSESAFIGLVDVYIEYGLSKTLQCEERQDMFIKAVVMCQYVINLRKKCAKLENHHDGVVKLSNETPCSSEIVSRLHRIKVELLTTMNVNSDCVITTDTVKHKMALIKLRKAVKEKISNAETIVDFSQVVEAKEDKFAAEMRGINKTVSSTMNDIVQEMISNCQLLLGSPPCDYVAVGLGSFAFGTMTPFSDLEWAVLLDIEDESFKSYFRKLSRLVHFKIASLGETIVPSVMVKSLNNEQDSWFYDDVTHRGFAADGAMSHACKTPLGRRDDSGNIVFELIHSPELMAQFQNQEWLNKSFELSASLRSFRTLYMSNLQKGNKIIRRYRQEIKNQLEHFAEEDSILPDEREVLPANFPDPCCLPKELNRQKLKGESGNFCDQDASRYVATKLTKSEVRSSAVKANIFATMRKHHMKKIIEKDIARYHLHDVVCTSDAEGMMYNVKKDLYRQPERLLCILFLKFGIEGADVYTGIEELHERGFIDAILRRKLITSISIACELRLQAYLDHDRQLEDLDIPSFIPCCSETVYETPESSTTKARPDRLITFYRILLPFLEEMMELKCETIDETRPLALKQTDLNYSPSYHNALIHLRLLRYGDAKYYSMKAVHENPSDPSNWRILARLLGRQGKYAEAFLCQRKSFCIHFSGNNEILSWLNKEQEIQDGTIWSEPGIQQTLVDTARSDMHFLSRCFHVMGLSSFFSSQYQRAWRFFRMVYYLLQKFPYLKHQDAVPSVFSNIALCLSAAGRYDEAICIFKNILDGNVLTSIQVPKARDNLGNAYLRTGNYLQALGEYREALKLRRNYYRSSSSPFLVISLVNIANVLSKLGRVLESMEFYSEGLKVIHRIYANSHAIYSELCLCGIGKNLISLGKYEEALSYCENGVKIAKKRRHNDRRTYAMALMVLGNCYSFLKRFDDAVIAYEESSTILQDLNVDITGQEEVTVLPHEVATIYCNLAVVLQQQGKFHAASRFLQRSEEKIASCVNKESHSDMGVVLHAKAKVLRSQGKTTEAKKAMHKALEIFTKAFGTDCPHVSIITTMIDLGNILVSQRQFVAAVDRYRMALCLLYSDTAPKDAFVQLKISAHKNIGYSYYQLKQISEAITCYKEALRIWMSTENEKSLNDIDKSLILSLQVEAGNAYIRGGNYHEAIQLFKVAVNTPISVSFGVCDLKHVAWTLAIMQQKMGLHLEAIESFERAVILHAGSGKDGDAFVVKCYQNEAALYRTLEDHDNACLLAEKALGVQLAITNSQPLENTAKLLAQVAEAWSYRNMQKALEFCRRSVQMIERLEAPAALQCNVFSDQGFYCHLLGLKEENVSKQRCLFEEAEVSYNKALCCQRNEPTLFNMGFLFMTTFRFVEAINLLNDILARSDMHSKVGLDSRDAKIMNPELRQALFSCQIESKAVVRSMDLVHIVKFQCYKALHDNVNARSEASQLIKYLTEGESPQGSDHTLLAFILKELDKLES